MSTINKLSIRGIRSFGPEKQDEQSISFSSPLTLIVGENGCGKTTVIECLKYALIGQLPAKSDSGRGFINDPNITHSNSSMGQVKLEVTDIQGNQKTCIRTARCEKAPDNKLKFSTVDSTISYKGQTQDHQGKRIEDVNQEMADTMGVSNAVLNSVIFCHQEDSNWPLESGKELKEKFDAIFGTTEYNKAIKKIRSELSDLLTELNLAKKDLVFKEATKKESEKKNLALNKLKGKRDKIISEVEDKKILMEKLNEELSELLQKERKFSEIITERRTLKEKIGSVESSISRVRSRIREVLDEDALTIDRRLQKFSEDLKVKENEKKKLMQEVEILLVREKTNHTEISDYRSKTERVADKIGTMQDKMGSRVVEMRKIAGKLNLELSEELESETLSGTTVADALEEIRKGIEVKEREIATTQQKSDETVQKMQQEIDEVREERIKVVENLKSLKVRVKEIFQEQHGLRQQISKIESSMPTLQKLESDIKETREKIEKIKSENDLDDMDEQKVMMEVEKENLEQKIADLDVDLEKLEKIYQIKNELDQKVGELESDQNELKQIRNKNSSKLKTLLPSQNLESKFRENLENLQKKLQSDVNKMKDSMDEKSTKIKCIKTELEHSKKLKDSKQNELKNIKSKIEDLCGDDDYDDVLQATKEKVQKLNLDVAFNQSSKDTFKHYISDIQDEPCCPLCHKDLGDNEQESLREEIEEKIRQLPRKIEETNKKLKKESEKFDRLNNVKSSYDGIAKLEKEIEDLEIQIKRHKDSEKKLSDEIEDMETEICEPNSKLEIISTSFLFDMSKLDELSKKISQKSQDVDELKAKMPADMPKMSIDELRNQKRDLNSKLKITNEEVNAMGKRISEIQKKIQSLQENLNEMITEDAELQKEVQGLNGKRKQISDLDDNKSEIQNQIRENEAKLDPLEENWSTLKQKKEKFRQCEDEKIKKMQKFAEDLKFNQLEIDRLHKEISDLEKQKLFDVLENLKQKILGCEKSNEIIEKEKSLKCERIEEIKTEVINHDGVKRNLEDNLELRRLENEKLEIVEKIKKSREKTQDVDIKKMSEDKKKLQQQWSEVSSDEANLNGQKKTLDEQIKKDEGEMNEDHYKNALKYYLGECYKVATLDATISDLKTYCAVLENAVIKFHHDKMLQVNQNIREYWTRIYKGNDIDYIEIKTLEDDETIKKNDKKRNYKYRVVQAKNGGAEIDMAGRCSAGQKVLASLIIRMALADSFCLNCGVLALDEPTTNLDQKNIESLCRALAQIVEEREKYYNKLMLIIITHDMEFIKSLDSAEHFYQLSRDPRGRSRIERIENY